MGPREKPVAGHDSGFAPTPRRPGRLASARTEPEGGWVG
jgi:hypothetical protein